MNPDSYDETRALEILQLYCEQKWSQGKIARYFGLSVNTVGRVVRGETYSRVYTQYLTSVGRNPAARQPPQEQSSAADIPQTITEELDEVFASVLEKHKPGETIADPAIGVTEEVRDKAREFLG